MTLPDSRWSWKKHKSGYALFFSHTIRRNPCFEKYHFELRTILYLRTYKFCCLHTLERIILVFNGKYIWMEGKKLYAVVNLSLPLRHNMVLTMRKLFVLNLIITRRISREDERISKTRKVRMYRSYKVKRLTVSAILLKEM